MQAEQASQLRQQLEEAQYAAAEREAAAAAAAAQNEELQARVALLQGAVLQLERQASAIVLIARINPPVVRYL
jgi:hypothetical protein